MLGSAPVSTRPVSGRYYPVKRPVPLAVLATIDPLIRDGVIVNLAMDAPGLVALRYDILDDEDGGALRRVVTDAGGVVEDLRVPLEHACLSCAIREDAVPTLARLAAARRWTALLLALPVSAESLAVTGSLGALTRRGQVLHGARLASVVCAVELDAAEHDLLGDELLAERGLGLTRDDGRSVAEALAAQLHHADVVVTLGEPAELPVASDLLDHVRARDGLRLDGLYRLSPELLLDTRHDAELAGRRLDPMTVEPGDGPIGHGVWSLDLRSPRPFHPERLVDGIERLGTGRLLSRGRFWVPTRPDSVCVWEGAGGQLGIGELGRWGRRTPSTRLLFTGTGDERPGLLAAFEELLLSPQELARGLAPWHGRVDVLAPWLGDRSSAA